jgi:hypothetical protein
MALHRAQILTLIVVVLVQSSSSFSVPQLPLVSRRVSGVSLPATQPSKDNDNNDNDSPRKTKRQRLAQVLQKLPQKPRSFLGVVVASVALWRGPNNQVAHAAVPEVATPTQVVRAEKIEAPAKEKDSKAALVVRLAVMAGGGGAGFYITRQKMDKKEEELSQEKANVEKVLQNIGEARNRITEVLEETKVLEEIKEEQESLTSNLEQDKVEEKVEEKIIAFSDIINLVQESAPPDLAPKVKITELEIVEASSVIEEIKTEPVSKPVVEQQTVIQEPVIEEAVIEEPVVEEVVVEEPVMSTEPVVAEEPVIEEAVVEEVVVEKPIVLTEPVVAEEPVIEEAVVEEPVMSTEPVAAEEPVIEEAVVEEAVVEEPAASTEPVVTLDESSTKPEVGLEQDTAFSTKDAEHDYKKARKQPKAPDEAQALKEKYAAIDSLEERAYQILVDLGIVEKLP